MVMRQLTPDARPELHTQAGHNIPRLEATATVACSGRREKEAEVEVVAGRASMLLAIFRRRPANSNCRPRQRRRAEAEPGSS